MKRRTDDRPDHRPPGVGAWIAGILGAIMLGAVLALAFAASGVRAATPQAVVYATVHDPLLGTHTLTEALDRLQYSGSLPAQWSIQTPQGAHTGTLSHLTYRGIAPGHYRAEVEYTVWVDGRVFAGGFEK